MKQFRKLYSAFIGLAALTFAAAGCSDELDYPHSTVEPGLPTTISVSVSLPEMTPITRADMSEGDENIVNSLWIGVYAKSGKLTGFKEVTGGEMKAHQTKVEVKDIPAETGESYIVAVANYKGRKCNMDGITRDLTYEEALVAADTYSKFKSIIARFTDKGEINVDMPQDALLMSGHYMEIHSDGNTNGSYSSPEPVEITENKNNQVSLTGSIHLRRLISQVKFNVKYNDDYIKDFQIKEYKIHNVPNQSWLYECERSEKELNAGDVQKLGTLGSYQSSTTYSQLTPDANKTWSFDWWQYENKRIGLDPEEIYDSSKDMTKQDYVKNDYYAYRELEHKSNGLNSKQYRSLVNKMSDNIEEVDPNNNATFVELKVRMEMTVDEKGVKLPNGSTRVVEATYTIHLGFCDVVGKDGETRTKGRDFNSVRNAKYTYNVTINNIKDIYVEATSNIEKNPGAEGIISDVSEQYVELDAHYGLYNIEIKASDLQANSETGESGFRYIIHCYDENGELVKIDSEEELTKNRRYLDWVEIMPTSGKYVLAKYKEKGKSIYKLDQFKKGLEDGTLTPGYYTIFFNEYVYEDQTWPDYVNKPDRQLWIRVLEAKSNDGESMQYVSRYAFSQKSIQTFYGSGTTALGLEHDNESYGLNLLNNFNNHESKIGVNERNGRYNTKEYIIGKKTTSWAEFVDFTNYQQVNAIGAYSNMKNKQQSARTIDKSTETGNPYPLPSIVEINGTKSTSEYYPDRSSSPKYIEAITACMNRNRDLNGDDVITADELRWYVPTTDQYTQIILGTPSLTKPLMDYSSYPTINNNTDADNTNMNLFLYGSNGEVLWMMEGFSTSQWGNRSNSNSNSNYGWYENAQYTKGTPWEVRCVRNLGVTYTQGTDLSAMTDKDEIDYAFTKRSGKNEIEMTYYESKSIRKEMRKDMKPHVISNQDLNKTYGAFEFKPDNVYEENHDGKLTLKTEYNYKISDYDGYSDYTKYDSSKKKNVTNWYKWLTEGNPCDTYNKREKTTGWRVPNQKELMILKAMGYIPDNGSMHISGTFAHYYKGNGYKTGTDFSLSDWPIMYVRTTSGVAAGTQQNILDSDNRIRCVRDVD